MGRLFADIQKVPNTLHADDLPPPIGIAVAETGEEVTEAVSCRWQKRRHGRSCVCRVQGITQEEYCRIVENVVLAGSDR